MASCWAQLKMQVVKNNLKSLGKGFVHLFCIYRPKTRIGLAEKDKGTVTVKYGFLRIVRNPTRKNGARVRVSGNVPLFQCKETFKKVGIPFIFRNEILSIRNTCQLRIIGTWVWHWWEWYTTDEVQIKNPYLTGIDGKNTLKMRCTD